MHIADNLIDKIWDEQPARTSNPIIALDTSVTGKTIAQKLIEIRSEMQDKSCEVLVVTALDEVAWLLNLRGSDIKYNPVFFAYAVITASELHFFVDSAKLPSNYAVHCESNGVEITLHPYATVQTFVAQQVEKLHANSKVWISSTSSYALSALVPPKQLIQDVCIPLLLLSLNLLFCNSSKNILLSHRLHRFVH